MQNHEWQNDDELMQLIKSELYTAVIGDIMDKMGYFHQFLSPKIQPLDNKMFIAGRAMTVLEADVLENQANSGNNNVLKKSFGLMLEALDSLKKNDVYICTGASPDYALWGELMGTRAAYLQAAGAIVDGYSRDTNGILASGFPTFSYGRFAQDQAPRGKVIDYNIPIKINKVLIMPGDLVVGDLDGVCIVPKAIEVEVISEALVKARGEKMVYLKIKEGMGAKEAFEKYGIL